MIFKKFMFTFYFFLIFFFCISQVCFSKVQSRGRFLSLILPLNNPFFMETDYF